MKAVCPIGIECDRRACPNYLQCKDLCISWEIPYYLKDGALIVKPYGWRCAWHEEAQGTCKHFCQLPSGDYKRLDGDEREYEIKNRLRVSWEKAGWVAATPLKQKT